MICCIGIRTLNLNRRFDAVISLFHVMSYQTSNENLGKAVRTAARHLAPDGIFIFDFWYGPAVLAERPERREKELSDEYIQVRRAAEPKELTIDNQ